MTRKMILGLSVAALVSGSAAVALANPASLSLVNGQAEAAAQVTQVLPKECADGKSSFVAVDGKEYSCETVRALPKECLDGKEFYLGVDGKEYACRDFLAARAKVGRGLGFFGYSAIALAASGGAAAAATGSNGRPASP